MDFLLIIIVIICLYYTNRWHLRTQVTKHMDTAIQRTTSQSLLKFAEQHFFMEPL